MKMFGFFNKGKNRPFDTDILEKEFSISFQESVISSIIQYNLDRDNSQSIYRVMDTTEIKEILNVLRDTPCYKDICPIFSDDNSNYVGIYHCGPLEGKIRYLNHEETDLSPGYRNIENLVNNMLKYPYYEWEELPHDYPTLEAEDKKFEEDSNRVICEIDKIISNEDMDEDYKQQLIYSKLTMMPYLETEKLYSYLISDDMYIQEKAVEIIRKRKYKPAAEHLYEVAKNGMQNGKILAIKALREINTKECNEYIKELKNILPKNYLIYFR